MKPIRADTIGIGVIGVGIRGQHAYETFLAARPDCRVVAVAQQPAPVPELLEGKDPQAYAQEWADHLGADYHADWRELLARDDVHIVSVMCDAAASPRIMAAVAAAGKHIVRDKFLAVSPADGRRAVKACEAAGVQVLMTYSLRYAPLVRRAIDRLREGAVGRPCCLRLFYLQGNGPLGGFKATRAYREAMGGGELTTFGVYAIDLAIEILGSLPRKVFCSQGAFFYPDYREAEMEDMAQLSLEFPSGQIAHILTGRTTTSLPPPGYFCVDVRGTRGAFQLTSPEPTVLSASGGKLSRVPWKPAWAVHAMLDDFIRRLRAGEPSPIPALRGLEVLQVINAAYRSARLGRPVEIASAD